MDRLTGPRWDTFRQMAAREREGGRAPVWSAGRKIAIALTLPAVAVGVVACEAKAPENLPRPPIPTTVSIAVSENGVAVDPEVIRIPGKRPININQNENARLGQAPRIREATVDFRISNQLGSVSTLSIEGPAERRVEVPGTATNSFQMALPTGIYRLSATGSDTSALLSVGPSRVSSGTSVLTP